MEWAVLEAHESYFMFWVLEAHESYFMFWVVPLFGLGAITSFFCLLLLFLVILGICYLESKYI